MTSAPRDMNAPLPISLFNANGTLTAQGQAFLRRLWERTGYAPGVDSEWVQQEADIASSTASQALLMAQCALREAKESLDMARQILLQAISIRDQAIKALDNSQDSSIIAVTARGNGQAAQFLDESMIFTIMKP